MALTSNKQTKLEELWSERENLVAGSLMADEDNQIMIAPDLAEIFEARKRENRISMTPKALNDQLEGGLLPGHHVVLYAVTDLGKTLFALDQARHFIDCGKTVLYVHNEDPFSDLIERFLVTLLGRDKWQIRKHYKKAQKVAEAKGWERMVWADLTPGTFPEIESLIRKHKPDILMVDQIKNLETGDKDGVVRLETAATSMRNLAKRHNIISISITQAGDSADGKAILGRGDIYGSNVGIPGTTDLMLGIGATTQQEIDGIRTLSFAKNKVSGNKSPIQVFFNTTTMRVE
jgi:predicted ATP-dependent serine protease